MPKASEKTPKANEKTPKASEKTPKASENGNTKNKKGKKVTWVDHLYEFYQHGFIWIRLDELYLYEFFRWSLLYC